MRSTNLSKEDLELVKIAKDLIKKRSSKISSVACALRTRDSKIFKGVNIYLECSAPCSICAEYSAIATMVSEASKKIDTIVAVLYWKKKFSILPPCGKCRQFMSEFGNPYVIVEIKRNLKKVKLSELNPLPCF